MTHYITLDGLNVVKLESGDYTKLFVKQGHHTFGLRVLTGGLILVPVPPFFIGFPRADKELYKEVELECRPGETYSYGIKLALVFNDAERLEFKLTDLSGEFELAGKTFVQPGTED